MNINLIHGDCLEILPKLKSKSVDLVLCDMPFETTACKWDKILPLDKIWFELERIIKDGSAIVLFGQEPFSSKLRLSNTKMYKYDWVWQKDNGTNFLSARYQAFKVHELISVFSNRACTYSKKGVMKYYPQMTVGGKPYKTTRGKNRDGESVYRMSEEYMTFESKSNGERLPQSVIKFSQERGFHPTQKPVPLLEYLIKTYTLENETVLDFTMGSGSTGVACVNLNRNFIGIELDEKYFNIAKERIDKALNDSNNPRV